MKIKTYAISKIADAGASDIEWHIPDDAIVVSVTERKIDTYTKRVIMVYYREVYGN